MEEFWKRFDAFSAQLQTVAGEAWTNLLLYKQAESIGYLAIGFVALIVSAILIWVIFTKLAPNWQYSSKPYAAVEPERYDPLREGQVTPRESGAWREWDYYRTRHNQMKGDPNPLMIFSSIFAAIAAAVLLIGVAGPNLLYIWNWIGAFVPEARLFHDIFEALGPKVTGTPAA